MDDESFSICEGCGRQVNIADDDVVYAVKLQRIDTMSTVEYPEGAGVLFHEDCFPGNSERYHRKQKPA